MRTVTQIQAHGPDERYLRTVIPKSVSCALSITKGDAVFWEVLDDNSAVLRIIKKEYE